MTRTFIAGLLSLSLAFSGVAVTPAQAGTTEEQLAKTVLGVAAIALLVQALDKNNNRSTAARQSARSTDGRQFRHGDHAQRRVLPGYCIETVRIRGDRVRVMDGRCLERNYRYANRLPERCELRTGNRGNGRGNGHAYGHRNNRHGAVDYSVRCLHREGYTIGRRH